MHAGLEAFDRFARLFEPAPHVALWKQVSRHVAQVDPGALAQWRNLTPEQRRKFVRTQRSVERVSEFHGKRLVEEHLRAHDVLKRFFVTVQQKTFEYGYLDPSWLGFLGDAGAQEQLLWDATRALAGADISVHTPGIAHMYGNIKPRESLNRKLSALGSFYRSDERGFNVWDCVRLRIVADNVECAREVAIAIWQSFFDKIACCRNYWFAPKNCQIETPYRAIHFLIAITPGRVVEVQIVPLAREIASLLDHKLLFKASVSFADAAHEKWLRDFVYKVNIFDARWVKDRAALRRLRS